METTELVKMEALTQGAALIQNDAIQLIKIYRMLKQLIRMVRENFVGKNGKKVGQQTIFHSKQTSFEENEFGMRLENNLSLLRQRRERKPLKSHKWIDQRLHALSNGEDTHSCQESNPIKEGGKRLQQTKRNSHWIFFHSERRNPLLTGNSKPPTVTIRSHVRMRRTNVCRKSFKIVKEEKQTKCSLQSNDADKEVKSTHEFNKWKNNICYKVTGSASDATTMQMNRHKKKKNVTPRNSKDTKFVHTELFSMQVSRTTDTFRNRKDRREESWRRIQHRPNPFD